MKTRRRVHTHSSSALSVAKEKLFEFVNSFRPSNFREYWLSRDGARRLGKIAAAGFVFLLLVLLWFGKDLPSPSKLNAKVSAQSTQFFDRTGTKLLYQVFGNENRTVIDFNAMPTDLKHATVAIEDKDFYKHGAFSVFGIGRAFTGVLTHTNRGGGSTITQQYVKNALLTSDRTLSRKIKELIVSLELEQLYKKDDILKLYLNEIPYGSQAYGVQAAAKTYFNKDAKDLTLEESALLAGIPQAPTYYSPYGQHKDALIARQHVVLDQMADQGYISKDRAAQAKAYDILHESSFQKVPKLYSNITAPHFVHYVQDQLDEKYGEKAIDEGGFKVITSIDLTKQKMAEDAISHNIASVRRSGGSNAALVSSDPKTGQILSFVGSYDYSDPNFGNFDVADAERQPGSSFKPFVYATAFGKNYGPGTTMYDVTTDFGGGYTPHNYSGTNYGVQSMRTALDGSLNIPAVKTLYMAGLSDSLKTAHNMGITTLNQDPSHYGLSLVLGSGEVKLTDMVNAYSSFANEGNHVDPVVVLKMTDPKGRVIEEYKPQAPKRVLDPQVAYLMSNVLSDNNARAYIFGLHNNLTLPNRPVAAKTGTTTDFRDAWTMGYTPSLVTGVWSGNNDNTPMTKEAVDISAPIWQDYMTAALDKTPVEQFQRPDGIKSVTLDANTGKLATPSSKATRTDLFPSWYKPTTVADSKSAKVDKVSGKLATDCTPDTATETVFASEIHAEIPSTDPAYSRWEGPVQALAAKLGYAQGGSLPTDSDDVHSCSDVKPQINLDVANQGGGVYTITAKMTAGNHPITKLDVTFDDQIISTLAPTGSTYSFDYTVSSNGSHTFKATVTDSVLYVAQDEQVMNVVDAGGSAGFHAVSPTDNATKSAGVIAFSWSSLSTADKYRVVIKKGTTTFPALNTSGTSASTALTAGTYLWSVDALDSSNQVLDSTPSRFLIVQ